MAYYDAFVNDPQAAIADIARRRGVTVPELYARIEAIARAARLASNLPDAVAADEPVVRPP